MKFVKIVLIVFAFVFSGCVSQFSQRTSYQPLENAEFIAADNIKSVWELSMQPCNGGSGNMMKSHPDNKGIIEHKVVTFNNLGIELKIPQHPDTEDTVVKIFPEDRSRGVSDTYLLLTKNVFGAPPIGAIVVTELPSHMRTRADAFWAVKDMQKKKMSRISVKPSFEKIDGPYGESIEMILKNRKGTQCFPTSKVQFYQLDSGLKTIGISRFSLINQHLVEFSIIVMIPEDMKYKDAKAYARGVMDSFWLGVEKL